ncbi:unnamed protein product [Lota lota]
MQPPVMDGAVFSPPPTPPHPAWQGEGSHDGGAAEQTGQPVVALELFITTTPTLTPLNQFLQSDHLSPFPTGKPTTSLPVIIRQERTQGFDPLCPQSNTWATFSEMPCLLLNDMDLRHKNGRLWHQR